MLSIHSLSKRWAEVLCAKADAKENTACEVYQYGIELLITNAITVSCILLMSVFLQSFWYGILYLMVFCPLKATCSGLHANTWLKCCIFSTLYYAITVIAERYLSVILCYPWIWVLILWGSCICIYVNAPIRNIRHPVGECVLKKNKRISTALLAVYLVILTVEYLWMGASPIVNFISLVIASIAVNIILAKGGRKVVDRKSERTKGGGRDG